MSQGVLDQFWLWSMQAGLKNAYESIKAFSETDFTEDLKKFDVPTLVMHGEDDQIVPVKDSAVKSARLIKGAKEIYYPGAPHGLTATLQDQVNADLLTFLKILDVAVELHRPSSTNLMQFHLKIIEYVVVNELSRIRIPIHSATFWQLVRYS